MPRRATGSVRERDGAFYAAFSVGKGKRISRKLAAKTLVDAEARATAINAAVLRMRTAGVGVSAMTAFVEDMASASPTRLAGLDKIIAEVCASQADDAPSDVEVLTFQDVADDWTAGRLTARYPGHVKKIDHTNNRSRLKNYVLPIVGDVPVGMFRLAHAERVLAQDGLPERSRRHVAQIITRVLALAVYPCKALPVSPIPKGWLPKRMARKAMSYLYPSEDARLLACTRVPLVRRFLYGVLDREGMRRSELLGLEWSDLDLERGAINLDETKTDDPRTWALDRSVLAGLKWWRSLHPTARWVFEADAEKGKPAAPYSLDDTAEDLRRDLRTAGVDRAALFERSEARQPIRLHDLRATFITLSLAAGKSEAWISDRTGHRSSEMINRYKRTARTAADLDAGSLAPLNEAIPELRHSAYGPSGSEGGTMEERESSTITRAEGKSTSSAVGSQIRPKRGAHPEKVRKSGSLDAVRAEWPPFATDVRSSSAIRHLRRTRVGRAHDDAVRAALSGDPTSIARAMYRLGRVHGGARHAPCPRCGDRSCVCSFPRRPS